MVKNIFYVIIGLILGAALGLYLGWVAWPTEFTGANPAVLSPDYRQEYARMTAVSYANDHDLEIARRRVASLDSDGQAYYFSLTMDSILRADNEAEIRQFVELAAALGLDSPAMVPFLPTTGGSDGE
jgi:hypothetical protein